MRTPTVDSVRGKRLPTTARIPSHRPGRIRRDKTCRIGLPIIPTRPRLGTTRKAIGPGHPTARRGPLGRRRLGAPQAGPLWITGSDGVIPAITPTTTATTSPTMAITSITTLSRREPSSNTTNRQAIWPRRLRPLHPTMPNGCPWYLWNGRRRQQDADANVPAGRRQAGHDSRKLGRPVRQHAPPAGGRRQKDAASLLDRGNE